MATNRITIPFTGCEDAPEGGYLVFYRPSGSLITYREAGPFTVSPIVIDDTEDPADTEYEGYVVADCGDGNFGPQVFFEPENDNPAFVFRNYEDNPTGDFATLIDACAHLDTAGFNGTPEFYVDPTGIDDVTHEITAVSAEIFADIDATVSIPDPSPHISFRVIKNLTTGTEYVVDFEGNPVGSSIAPEYGGC